MVPKIAQSSPPIRRSVCKLVTTITSHFRSITFSAYRRSPRSCQRRSSCSRTEAMFLGGQPGISLMTRNSTSNHDKLHALYYNDWVRHSISRIVPPVICPHVHEDKDESEYEKLSPSIDLLNGIRRVREALKAFTWSHKSAEPRGYCLALVHWRQGDPGLRSAEGRRLFGPNTCEMHQDGTPQSTDVILRDE
jgi:hypothetical protein